MPEYEDVSLATPTFGFPEIVVLDEERAVVSDWTGKCRLVSIANGSVEADVEFSKLRGAVGSTLCSLRFDQVSKRCAVATRSPWAGIWALDNQRFARLHSESGSKVSAVALAPGGDWIALGLGLYPLEPGTKSTAAIEIWSLPSGTPELCVSAALPGACVDWVGWHPHDDTIVVITGMQTQDGGFIVTLDRNTLCALTIEETGESMVSSAEWVDGLDALAIATQTQVSLRYLRESARSWNRSTSNDTFCACYDVNRHALFTSLGTLLDAETGDEIDCLEPLPDCTYVAILPQGGYIGVATSGVMRIWR